MNQSLSEQNIANNSGSSESFDYSYVQNTAVVAVYDDMKMPPKMIKITPAPTTDFIEHLATCINDEKNKLGGKIPYGAIREVSENFIHAQFTEAVVSILDNGNTIRFCDQGPGINDKEKATLPGYTSATKGMKDYIRGVGSGLPLVKEYLDFSGGHIYIEDNLRTGAVVTITLSDNASGVTSNAPETKPESPTPSQSTRAEAPIIPMPPLNDREIQALRYFATEGAMGVKELAELQGLANSSAHSLMGKMEQSNLIERTPNKKRVLTDYGFSVFQQLNS